MNNWSTIRDIVNWIPDFDTFSKPHGYRLNMEQALCHSRILFETSGKTVELHTATDESMLGRITITKEIIWDTPLAISTYITTNINLHSRGAKKAPDFNRGMNSRKPRP